MGIPYETFLLIFAVANAAFGAMTQAGRLALSLYGRAFPSEVTGRVMSALHLLGQLVWPILMVIGFLSLRWYLVIVLFLVSGGVASIAYTVIFVRRGREPTVIHNFAAGILGACLAGATAFLWVQRLMH